MDCFWASIQNKIQFQKFFKTYFIWHKESFSCSLVYLSAVDGGYALKIEAGVSTEEPLLSSAHEEADEIRFLHIDHAVKYSNVDSVLVASSNTVVFVCAYWIREAGA